LNIDPRDWGAECKACPFSNGGLPSNPVVGIGPPNPDGIIVGEAPSFEDVEQGQPFSGPTGREFEAELTAAGLDRRRFFIVNAVCCRPTERGDKPLKQAAKCCRSALLHQLRPFEPETPTLALGKHALASLLGREKGVLAARGFIRWGFKIPKLENEDE